jgi:hypothetical protein
MTLTRCREVVSVRPVELVEVEVAVVHQELRRPMDRT